MSGESARPASKKNPGTSRDVTELSAGKVERAAVYASLDAAIRARNGVSVVVAGPGISLLDSAVRLGCRKAPGVISWKGLTRLAAQKPVSIVVSRPAPSRFMRAALALVERHAGVEVCFLDYVVWLPGGMKNAATNLLNLRINTTSRLCLTGYILDAEGRPGVIVGNETSNCRHPS